MKVSSGIAVIWKNKVLVAHSKNASWFKTYTPPKGGIEEGEEAIDAAVREFKEEVGIAVEKSLLTTPPVEVPYVNPKGGVYKKVILFPLYIRKLSEIGLKTEKVPLSQLQLEEVDDAKFMTVEEFKERVLPRYHEPLKELIEKKS
jgi:ADP-ribose pyrophosphatase YjhB (NUDIX family)